VLAGKQLGLEGSRCFRNVCNCLHLWRLG